MKRFINAICSGFFVGGLAVCGLLILKFSGAEWFAFYSWLVLILFIVQIIIGKVLRK